MKLLHSKVTVWIMFSRPLPGALGVLRRVENMYFHPSPYDKILRLFIQRSFIQWLFIEVNNLQHNYKCTN